MKVGMKIETIGVSSKRLCIVYVWPQNLYLELFSDFNLVIIDTHGKKKKRKG